MSSVSILIVVDKHHDLDRNKTQYAQPDPVTNQEATKLLPEGYHCRCGKNYCGGDGTNGYKLTRAFYPDRRTQSKKQEYR